MEGFMSKWTNMVSGWKKRYFVLEGDILKYSKGKCQQFKGQIHLNIAKLIPHKKNNRQFSLDTGTTRIHLRGYSPEETEKWKAAILRTQRSSREIKSTVSPTFEHRESFFDRGSIAIPNCDRLTEAARKLDRVGILRNSIQNELKKLRKGTANDPGEMELSCMIEEFQDLTSDVFALLGCELQDMENYKKSLAEVGLELKIDIVTLIENKLKEKRKIMRADSIESLHEEENKLPEQEEEELFHDAVDASFQDIKSTNIIPHRNSLPVLRNPNQRINVIKLIKDSIGKDLSRVAVPVYLNEPLSFIQRFSEDLAYSEVILNAVQAKDSVLRMAYACCFVVSTYCTSIHRTMKPFNPLLGETFSLETNGFKLIAEQVCHHPPVAACHCEHPDYLFWASTEMKSCFRGNYLAVVPIGLNHLLLKNSNDHFVWEKPVSNAQNIIVGKIYVEHVGNVEVKNINTGDLGKINFKKKGWFDKQSRDIEALVFDSDNNLRYRISGRYDDRLIITNEITGQEMEGLKLKPFPENFEMNYFFSDYTLQLNLPPELVPGLPRTDSRYRPDQRALENGDIKTATSEKFRLEEKQRAARRRREEQGEEYNPRWFEFKRNEWAYRGGYWEEKEQARFTNIPDIF